MIFRFNLLKIEKNNADNSSKVELAVNMFADRTQQEFAKVLGTRPPPDDEQDDKGIDDGLIESFGDGRLDYTNDTCNAPPENQGKLHSCISSVVNKIFGASPTLIPINLEIKLAFIAVDVKKFTML